MKAQPVEQDARRDGVDDGFAHLKILVSEKQRHPLGLETAQDWVTHPGAEPFLYRTLRVRPLANNPVRHGGLHMKSPNPFSAAAPSSRRPPAGRALAPPPPPAPARASPATPPAPPRRSPPARCCTSNKRPPRPASPAHPLAAAASFAAAPNGGSRPASTASAP